MYCIQKTSTNNMKLTVYTKHPQTNNMKFTV